MARSGNRDGWLVLTLGVIGVSVLIWLATRGEDGPDLGPRGRDSTEREVRQDGEEGRARRSIGEQIEPPAVETPNIPVEYEAPGTEAESKRQGPRVLLLDDRGDRPIPGAHLAFVDESGPARDTIMNSNTPAERFEELALRHGRFFVADRQGLVQLPRFRGKAQVRAYAPGLVSPVERVFFEDSIGEVRELALYPAAVYQVEVVDLRGAPRQGLVIGLIEQTGNPHVLRETQRAMTDAQGRASFFGISLNDTHDGRKRWARAVVPFADAPMVELVADAAQPARLVVPSGGSMLIRAEDGEGNAVQADLRMTLSGEDPERPERSTPSVELFLPGGRGIVEPVDVGLTWTIRGAPADGSRDFIYQELKGPERAGERREMVLVFEDAMPMIAGRILDIDGRPLASSAVTMEIVNRNIDGEIRNHDGLGTCWTDARGRFRFGLEDDYGSDEGRHRLIVERAVADGAIPARAELDLPDTPWMSAAVGDVRLEPAPLLASGRVVDMAGNPLAGVAVTAFGEGWRGKRLADIVGPTVRSDAEGLFRLHGLLDEDEPAQQKRLRLRLRKPGHRERHTDVFDMGAEDLELSLGRGGVVEASFLLPPGIPVSAIVAEVVGMPAAPAGFEREPDLRRGEPARRGRPTGDDDLIWTGLGAGKARLRIATAQFSRGTVLEIDDLEIPVEGRCNDARLVQIDLRDLLWSAEIRVIDEQGLPVSGARLRGASDGRWSWRARSDEDGIARLTAHEELTDLIVRREGFATLRQKGPIKDEQVVLRKAPEVEIRLEGSFEMPKPPLWISCRAIHTESSYKDGGVSDTFYFGPEKKLILRLPELGKTRLDFTFVKQSSHSQSMSSSWPDPLPDRVIEISDSGERQIFRIEVDGAELRKAIAAVD